MLETIDEAGVRELRLARPPVNALNPALIERLIAAVRAAPAAGCRALVLSGAPGVFSAGLDVPTLLTLDRAGLRAFFGSLWDIQAVLARSPIPIVAAITGHAPAGGTVLAVYCDYRVMARGEFTMGLNEVQVGLVPGPVLQRVYERLVGVHRAAVLLTRGALVSPEDALAYGLVDELAEPDATVRRAHEYAQRLLALPSHAMTRARATTRAALAAPFDGDGGSFADEAVDFWFGAETQARLKALFEKRR
jgi:enoyl-CoA hydratase/carnithine racemase